MYMSQCVRFTSLHCPLACSKSAASVLKTWQLLSGTWQTVQATVPPPARASPAATQLRQCLRVGSSGLESVSWACEQHYPSLPPCLHSASIRRALG